MIYLPLLVAKILNRTGLIHFVRVGYVHKIFGRTFKIPVIEGKEGLNYFQSLTEPFILEVLSRLYSQKDFLFLDGGVNFGQTLLKVKAVSSKADYIGFEPSGLCAYYVSRLVKANEIPNVNLVRCALADETSVVTLAGYSEGDTRATIERNIIPKENIKFSERVSAFTLDSFSEDIASFKKDIILKIDVEGAELRVILGGLKLIEKFRPVILFENLPHLGNNERAHAQLVISQILTERNFNLFLLDELKFKLCQITQINNASDYGATNFLAVPIESRLELD